MDMVSYPTMILNHAIVYRQRGMSSSSRRRWPGRGQFGRWILLLSLAMSLAGGSSALAAGQGSIQQDAERKLVTLSDGQGQLTLRLNYYGRCVLDQVIVRGREVEATSGVDSGISLAGHWITTQSDLATPRVAISKDTLTVTQIVFGQPGSEIQESWQFTVKADRIVWRITRNYSKATTLEDSAFPEWDFRTMATWTGGMLDDGGVVWNKYLETPNATYGAHAGAVTFWNREQHDGLRISATLPKELHGTVRFSHQKNDVFSFNFVASDGELKPKHDLRRFLGDRQDLWAPFPAGAGEVSGEFALQALDYDQAYNRGNFQGLDGGSVR